MEKEEKRYLITFSAKELALCLGVIDFAKHDIHGLDDLREMFVNPVTIHGQIAAWKQQKK